MIKLKTDNEYLEEIARNVGADVPEEHRSNNYYLKRIEENTRGGGGGGGGGCNLFNSSCLFLSAIFLASSSFS